MTQYDYEIVAGWNGTTANIEGISVPGATALSTILPTLDADTHYLVSGLGQYDVPPQFTGGGITSNGYAIVTWTFPLISTLALEYLIANYGQDSSQAGKVTVNTRLHTETYVEKNAYLYVPYPNVRPTLIRSSFYGYQDVTGQLRIVGDTS